MRSIVLALAIVATPAAAADQFDLVCKGIQKTSPNGKARPYEVRYRVDLARMIYCRFACKATEAIARADAARITFQLPASDRVGDYLQHFVDRLTGRWVYYLGIDSDAEGVCEAAPFTGLSAQKF